MYCTICQNDLVNCTCKDIDERMADLGKSPNFVFKACAKCGKHYARCKCKNPEWTSSNKLKVKQKEKK